MRRFPVRTFCWVLVLLWLLAPSSQVKAQDTTVVDTIPVIVDTVPYVPADTVLRIKNINPYFTLHVDSTLNYQLEINKDPRNFYWFLRNSPVGLRINKDNGMLTFKAEKSYFMSGKLKYDTEYRVNIGVQSLNNPTERIDTFFSITFYNTDIIASRLKPSVSSTLYVDEGDTIAFKVQCENGSFPIENITFYANTPLKNFTQVRKCDDDFMWSAPFDFVKETDSARVKILQLSFVGVNRFMVRDTATVRIVVRDALNYPLALQEYRQQVKNTDDLIIAMKYTFIQLDKGVKRVKGTRTTFDITSSTTALTGSILASSTSPSSQNIGKVMPSVGVTLVPVKEAVAPQKVFDQNQASALRGNYKRLEYILRESQLVGERDPDITKKTAKLKDEIKQMQAMLVDVPLGVSPDNMTREELEKYLNSPKVNRKYRLKRR
ncbi:MAG: hypothetical protein EOO04_11780 [Chitinophagaceae bacterium]|nr:MAG: hypothetical protein EOO04_11780 [Chitinophagaceae bacterium]